eukprot:7579304-Pyramimonas_sp.AAC.1
MSDTLAREIGCCADPECKICKTCKNCNSKTCVCLPKMSLRESTLGKCRRKSWKSKARCLVIRIRGVNSSRNFRRHP